VTTGVGVADDGIIDSNRSDRPKVRVQVPDSVADEELIKRCRAGQTLAWSTLVRRYQRLIFTIPLRAGLGEEAAADILQITFGRLFENLDRLEDAARVRAWLVTTAKRESLLQLHLQQRRAEHTPHGDPDDSQTDLLAQLPDPSPLAEEQLAELQLHNRLRQAVDRLDPRSRQFVELAFLEDEPLSYSELAARLGIAEGSIGPTRVRCLEKLRRLLAEF
jgi:RNA polymerase sigma factor (sigma-70 family)